MTEAWKNQVRAELAARGASQDWLAREVGAAGRGTISKLLKPSKDGTPTPLQVGSALVTRISEVLGIPMPLIATPDAKTARVMELLAKSPEPLKDAILSMLEAALKHQP